MVFFSYQTRALGGSRGDGRSNLQESMLGALVGGINGYLIWGSLWYFMDINNYPLAPAVIAPSPGSPSDQALQLLPLVLLGGGVNGNGDLLAVAVIVLFLFEFVEGNTVTRLYFMRLRRLTNDALMQGGVTPELIQARQEHVPTFTHFLDIPMLLLIVSVGTMTPSTWTQFIIGAISAIAMATVLTVWIPRLYPWVPPAYHKPN